MSAPQKKAPGIVVCDWPFRFGHPEWDTDQLIASVAQIEGLVGVEMVPHSDLKKVEDADLVCASILPDYGEGTPPFSIGFCNNDELPRVHDQVGAAIEAAASCKEKPCVVVFTGVIIPTIDAQAKAELVDPCVTELQKIAKVAESKGVTLVLEHLNDRDVTTAMTGHEGYVGNDLDLVTKIVREVGSPNLKLLFDFYHVQLMHGDVIRRFVTKVPDIGHMHIAGVPGRCELDTRIQELRPNGIWAAICDSSYQGYVGLEYQLNASVKRDPVDGLKKSIAALLA